MSGSFDSTSLPFASSGSVGVRSRRHAGEGICRPISLSLQGAAKAETKPLQNQDDFRVRQNRCSRVILSKSEGALRLRTRRKIPRMFPLQMQIQGVSTQALAP